MLNINHNSNVASLIRQRIDDFDAYNDYMENEDNSDEIPDDDLCSISFGSGHITLGSAQKPIKISELREVSNGPTVFAEFHKYLRNFLVMFLASNGLRFQSPSVKIQPTDTVCILLFNENHLYINT